MQELNKYLDTFQIIIDDLIKLSFKPNVRLSGSLILKLHGLNFSRAIGDIDLIIINTTDQQDKYLQALKFFELENKEETYPGEVNYKFKKNNLILNIITKNSLDIFESSLYHKHNNKYYSISLINDIIHHKKSYTRIKDLNDFILLKNENFN
jgi:hypothetical protein